MTVHAVVLIACEIDQIPAHDDLATVIPGGIAKVPGVVRTETLIAFQVYSRHDLERLFAIGFDET